MSLPPLKLRYIAEGRCTNCGKPNPGPQKYKCPECIPRQAASNKKYREKKIAKGLCMGCSQPRGDSPSFQYCHNCFPRKNKEAKISTSKRKMDRKVWVWSFLKSKGCAHCPENNPACLDFHHRDPSQKTFNIGKGWRQKPWDDVLAEIEKCDILCSNCHRKLHFKDSLIESKIVDGDITQYSPLVTI